MKFIFKIFVFALWGALFSCSSESNENEVDLDNVEFPELPEIDSTDNDNHFYTGIDEIDRNYELIWNDEFEGNSIDSDKWKYRLKDGKERDGHLIRNANIHLDGEGHLVIETTKDEDGYHNSQLTTADLFETTYGYFETRAKLNKEIGPQNGFWLQSPSYGEGDPKEIGAEIDIYEYVVKQPEKVHHTIHWNGYGDKHQKEGKSITIPDLDSGYHTFGLLWTKDSYTFYVDGKKTWSTDKGLSQRDQYIIVSNGLTGWGGDLDKGNFPDKVLYDYVRVYKPK